MKKIIITVTILLSTASIYAGGFQINEQGAKAMSMANAFTGVANNPSAIFFNPAGITQLKGTKIMAGVSLIAPSSSFVLPNGVETEMESQIFTPFDFYLTHQFTDKFAAGLSVNNQYGNGTKWPADWVGRRLAVETEIKTFFFTPVLAYQISDQLSLSAGAVIAYGDVKITRKSAHPITSQPDFAVELAGDALAFGFTAGVLYKPIEQFSVGVSYRSEVNFDFEGTATSTPAGFTHPLAGFIPFPTGNITAPLTTPQNITLGFGLMPSDQLTIAADLQYVGWSSYDKLEVTFENYDLDPATAGVQKVQSATRDYENTFILRGGAEYKFSDMFALRGGLFYDKNPIKDEFVEPTLPDGNRVGINIGFGYNFTKSFGVDVGYLLLMVQDREVSNSVFGFNGTYTNMINVFAADFSFAL